MKMKRYITIFLAVSLSAMAIILLLGLIAPDALLSRLARPDTAQIAVDKNGKPIEGATVITNEDGSMTVVDSSGKTIEDAGTATVAADENTSTQPQNASQPAQSPQQQPSTPSNPQTQTPAPSPTPAPTPAPSPAPAPTPAPQPPASTCGSGGSCTAAEVASHNSQSNCWVIYSSKVFNVTGYVSQHPGGRSNFNSNTCGKDISAYLSGTREPMSGDRQNHSSSAYTTLNSYFVANLR